MPDLQDRPFTYSPPAEGPTVLFADRDIVVVDKPSGLLTVAGVKPGLNDCLESRIVAGYPTATIIHRLDLDTSGVLVLGLNKRAHAQIGIQFEKRLTRKIYVARVCGEVAGDSGEIDLPLATDWPNRPRQRVDLENGRPAQTTWEVLSRRDGTTRLRLMPRTGRSHQLRVHMLELGHPILGDSLYAPDEAYVAAERLQLHAESLAFTHPGTGEWVEFTAPCPF